MKKRMEKLADELFRPLTLGEQRRITGRSGGGGPMTTTLTSAYETSDPAPDWARDGDNE